MALRRPMVGLAFSLAFGIVVGLHVAGPVFLIATTGLALCLAAMVFARGSVAVHVAAALCGWLLTGLAIRNPSPRCISSVVPRDREYAAVIVVVDDDPGGAGVSADGATTWTVPARVEGIRRVADWQRARGAVNVMWKAPHDAPPAVYGDRWQLSGLLRVDKGEGREAMVRLYADPQSARRLGAGFGNGLLALCFHARAACGEILARGIQSYSREVGLIRALLLGYREDMPDDLYRAFTQTGTLHIVAISGSHVGVFLLIVIALVKALGLSRQHWILLVGPVLVVYAIGTGMSASAVRACIMAIVFWLAPLFRRRQDGFSALALSAILILLVAPVQLTEAGFVLSFGIVGGMMLLYPPLVAPLHRHIRMDPWRIQEESRPVQWVRTAGTHLSTLVAASVAAWLVSTPLTSIYFNNISFVSLVANLFVIPLAGLILMTGCLSLCFGAGSVLLAEIFNHANRLFTSALLWLVDTFNTWPQGHVFVQAPAWPWIFAWYAVVCAVILGSGRIRRAGLLAGAVAIVAAVALYVTDRSVDVELSGASGTVVALVNVPGGGDVLINAGPEWSGRKVLRWLHARGVDRLRALVITSPRADTAGGAPLILDQVPVDELWAVPYEGRSPVFAEVMRMAVEKGISVRRLSYGDRGSLAGNTEWEVLHPGRDVTYSNAGDAGMVLRIARGSASVLYMDTCGPSQKRDMLARPIDLAASALVLGTAAGIDAEWLRTVRPETVVLNAGAPAIRPDHESPRVVLLANGESITLPIR